MTHSNGGMVKSGLGAESWLYNPQFHRDWRRTNLSSLAQWINGLAFRPASFSSSGRPIIKIAEIKNGVGGQTKFTEDSFSEAYLVREGDVLFSWSGQPETSIDVFRYGGPEGWINQHVFRVLVDRTKCGEDFFFYLMKYLRPQFIAIASNKQTTGLGHVTRRDLERITVALPSLGEQRAIARILGTLDDKIELNRRMNRTLEELARALFTSWFVDFDPVRAKAAGRQPAGMDAATAALFPDAFEPSNMGPVPAGWRVDPLSAAAEINPPRPLRRGDVAPYLDMANLPTAGPRAVEWVDRPYGSGSRFRNDDTLLARITPCLENGKTGFVDFLSDGEVGWGSTEFIVLRSRAPLPPIWAYCVARHHQFREFAIRAMSGTSGRQRVPSEAIGRFKVINPPESIASRFAEIVEPLFDAIRQRDQEARTLASTRDLLLPRLLSGDLTAPVTEELAEVVQ